MKKLAPQETLQLYFENASDLFIEINPQWEIVCLNNSAENLLNSILSNGAKSYEEALMVNLGLNELVKSSDFSNELRMSSSNFIFESSSPNGVSVRWNIHASQPKKDKISIILVGKDLTEIYKLSQETQDIKSSFETMIAYLPGNVYWMDRNCIHIGCNDNVLKMTGLSKNQYIGKTYEELAELAGWTHGEAQSFKKDDLEVLTTGLPKRNIEEPLLRHVDGSFHYYLTSRVPMLSQKGDIIGVAGISVDITERKKMEEDLLQSKEKAKAANLAKSAFITNMSHDIRTPLSGIIGMADMLEKEGDSTKDREYGHTILETSDRLLSLLNDILEIVSADEAREENINFITFNLLERINHVRELFLSSSQIKNLALSANISPDLPEYIVSDRIKVDRILLNLISNALKFTNQGHVKLGAQLLARENKKALLQFTVSDTGAGIPQDKITHIFDRFYKIDPSYEGRHVGYGVGLFLVKKFVTLLGGEITVTSKLGKGTEFKVILPIEIGKAEEAKKQPEPRPLLLKETNLKTVKKMITSSKDVPVLPVKDRSSKLNVLFIEDDNIARRTGQYILESADLQVCSVTTAEEAIKLAKSQLFDLIVTDIGLPGMDGNEFAVLLRHWERKLGKKPLPIVGLSAHVSSETKAEAEDAGINAMFSKPLNDDKTNDILNIFKLNRDSNL